MTDFDPGRPLTLRQVIHETGLTRSTIYRKIAAGTFPAGFKIDGTMHRWWECDIRAWKTTLPPPSSKPGSEPGISETPEEKAA